MPWLSRLLARLTRGSGEPHAVLAAHRAAQAGRDPRMLLDALPFVAVDTELTGFDPRRDAVVSVAAVRLRGLSIMAGETYATLVRPDRDVPRDSSLIHRLTATALDSAPPMAEALAGLLDFIGPAVIIGHHVNLDMAFINAASRRIFGGELASPCIDTLRLAQIYEEKRLTLEGGGDIEQAEYTLPALCRRYHLPSFAAHDARHDALAAAYLFLYLAKKLGRGRPLSLSGLWRAGRLWWM